MHEKPQTPADIYIFPFRQHCFVLDVPNSFAFELLAPHGGADLPPGGQVATSHHGHRPPLPEIESLSEHEWRDLRARGLFVADRIPDSLPPDIAVGNTAIVELSATHRCSLRCRYCYSPHTQEERKTPLDMPLEVIDAALEWALRSFSDGFPQLHVSAGVTGEGLLATKAYEHIVTRIRGLRKETEKSITCAIGPSNLTLGLQPKSRQWLCGPEAPIGAVSFDGPRHIHDAMRRFPDGSGSYDVVVEAFQKLREAGTILQMNGVVTGETPNVTDMFLHMVGLGATSIAFRPVRARPEEPFAINEHTIEAVKQGQTAFVDFLFSQDDEHLLTYLLPIWGLNDRLCRFFSRIAYRHRILYRCRAGKDNICVDTDGSIYACPGMVGIPELRMGSIFTGIDEAARKLYFEDLLVTRKEPCKNCWARYLCGGGCYHCAYLVNGCVEIPDPYDCELTKHMIRLAVYMVNRLTSERERVYHALPHPVERVVSPHVVVACPSTTSPPDFESMASAWRSPYPLVLRSARQMKRRLWGGREDISGEIHLQWDAHRLYFYAEICGSYPHSRVNDELVDLYLADREEVERDSLAQYWKGLAPFHVIRFHRARQFATVTSRRGSGKESETNRECVASVKLVSDRTVIRAAIPWQELVQLAPGQREIAVNAILCPEGAYQDGMNWVSDSGLGVLRLL